MVAKRNSHSSAWCSCRMALLAVAPGVILMTSVSLAALPIVPVGGHQGDERAAAPKAETQSAPLFAADAPKPAYVGKYGQPLQFSCTSSTGYHNVLCLAEKLQPQGSIPWGLACNEYHEDSFYFTAVRREFQIIRLTERYAGSWKCGLTGMATFAPPPRNRSQVVFNITIDEEAPERTWLTFEPIGSSEHKVLLVPSESTRHTTVYISNWSPSSKLALSVTCATMQSVYPSPQLGLTSPEMDLGNTDNASVNIQRTSQSALLSSPSQAVPGMRFFCAASNKLGQASSSATLKLGYEPEVIPVSQCESSDGVNYNQTLVSHVFGEPLGRFTACLSLPGVPHGKKCITKMTPNRNHTFLLGKLGRSTVHFTWTRGYVQQGRHFCKAVWTMSQPQQTEGPHYRLAKAKVVFRIRNLFTGRTAKGRFIVGEMARKTAASSRSIDGEQKPQWPPLSQSQAAPSTYYY